jgi:hypothetical protein
MTMPQIKKTLAFFLFLRKIPSSKRVMIQIMGVNRKLITFETIKNIFYYTFVLWFSKVNIPDLGPSLFFHF